MRSIFFIALLSLILAFRPDTKAGGWTCNNYLLEFTLDNHSTIRGHYLDGNYYEIFGAFQEDSFMHYLAVIPRYNDSITIFRKIEILEYPQADFNPVDSCAFKFSCAYPRDIVNFKIAKIKSVKLIDISPCGVCDVDNGHNGYYSNGISPAVITELTDSEIESLKSLKPVNAYSFDYGQRTSLCYVISYNEKIGEADFHSICNETQSRIEKSYSAYDEMKNNLRSKNIILIRLQFDL